MKHLMDTGWNRLASILSQQAQHRTSVEVLVIGGGVAGLAAATRFHKLGRDFLILESENRVGGRIQTWQVNGWPCELGAVSKPFGTQDQSPAPQRLGIQIGGRTVWGATAEYCLHRLSLLPNVEASRWTRDCLPERTYLALNAFFQAYHPGRMDHYMSIRRPDGLRSLLGYPATIGNEAELRRIAQTFEHRVLIGCRVTSVLDHGTEVTVVVDASHGRSSITANAVILTLPAPEVSPLLVRLTNRCSALLKKVQFGRGLVCALLIIGRDIHPFSYIVTPKLATSMVTYSSPQPGTSFLVGYFAEDKANPLWSVPDAEVTEVVTRTILQLGLIPKGAVTVVDYKVRRWAGVGPIISESAYGGWNEADLKPSPRVWLSGDWTWVDLQEPMPYGVEAARRAGDRAAMEVCMLLEQDRAAASFQADFLADAEVFEVTKSRGRRRVRRLGSHPHGNVALYGWVLRHQVSTALITYLFRHRVEDLWEYQTGYGVTAEDSAIVMEGLLAATIDRTMLQRSAQALVDRFYDTATGAFHTCHQGRAPYWYGPSIDATALCAWLLSQIDRHHYWQLVEKSCQYLLNARLDDGSWRGKWFCLRWVTTYHVLRCLKAGGYDAAEAAVSSMRGTQSANGSWSNSVIDTSAAILALQVTGGETEAIRRAAHWLKQTTQRSLRRGEQFLTYWFEEPDGRRLFFICTDRGALAESWAGYALATVSEAKIAPK